MALIEALCSLLDLKTILLGLGAIYLWRFVTNPLNSLPGPWGLPLIGCLPWLVTSNKEMQYVFLDWSKKYGKIFSFNICMKSVVVLNDYESIHEGFCSADIQSRPEMTILMRSNKGKGRSQDLLTGACAIAPLIVSFLNLSSLLLYVY